MKEYSVGDIVQVTGPIMSGSVGTVVYLYEKNKKYLVRFSASSQDFYLAEELKAFTT